MRDSFKDWELFNIAADIEVNQYIQSKWRPPGCLLPSTFPTVQLETLKGTKYYYESSRKLKFQNPDPN